MFGYAIQFKIFFLILENHLVHANNTTNNSNIKALFSAPNKVLKALSIIYKLPGKIAIEGAMVHSATNARNTRANPFSFR